MHYCKSTVARKMHHLDATCICCISSDTIFLVCWASKSYRYNVIPCCDLFTMHRWWVKCVNSILWKVVLLGFPLGSTVQSKTKGIWVWCRPHPKDSEQVLLLMDSEGLGDVEKVILNYLLNTLFICPDTLRYIFLTHCEQRFRDNFGTIMPSFIIAHMVLLKCINWTWSPLS